MPMGLGAITRKNVQEWRWRMGAWESTGRHLGIKDKQGWNPSIIDITRRIGLSTNVTTITRKQ